jgi:hypothetical protein
MPVEFPTDNGAAAYGRYAGAPSQADLERVFFLDADLRTPREVAEGYRSGQRRAAAAAGAHPADTGRRRGAQPRTVADE